MGVEYQDLEGKFQNTLCCKNDCYLSHVRFKSLLTKGKCICPVVIRGKKRTLMTDQRNDCTQVLVTTEFIDRMWVKGNLQDHRWPKGNCIAEKSDPSVSDDS